MATTVIHIKDITGSDNELYIGRAKGNLPTSIWHNPFVIGIHGNRDQVLRLYAEYLSRQTDLLERIDELKDRVLVCYCKPNACHGDILAALADSDNGITYGDITINKLTKSQEDTMSSNPQYIEITFTTDITADEVKGKDVVNWLRTDLNVLRPMRFVGLVVEQNAAHLNTDVAFISKATFSVEEPLSKPELVKPWVEKTINSNTSNYTITVTNVVIDNQSQEDDMPTYYKHIILVEWATDFTTSQIGEQLLGEYQRRNLPVHSVAYMPNVVNLNGKMLGEVAVPFTLLADRPLTIDEQFGPRLLEEGMEPLNFRVKEVTDNPFVAPETPHMNHIYNPSKEDTMPETPDTNPPSLAEKLVTNTEEKPMQESLFPLSTVLTDSGTEGVEFVVSFRPNAETEWDQEIVVPTLIRAMHYIAQQKIVSGEYKVDSVIGDTTINVNINHTKEDKVYEYKMAADWSSYMEVRVLTNVHDDGEQYAIKVYNDLLGTQQRLHWREPERPGKVWMDQEKTFERQLEMTADYLTERNGEPSNGIKVTPMFVSTNWRYAFLQERIIAVGGKFRIMSFGKKTITKMDADAEELPLTLDDLIASSSFSYAEGDNLVIMNVANHAGQHISWDEFADYVGVNINMFVNDKPSTKLGKRIKEVMRNTLYADYMTKPLDILGVEFDPSLEKAVDGIGGTSMSCFLRMVSNISDPTVRNQSWRDVKNGTITRYSLRYLMGEGLFKGDGIIVPDEVLKAMYPEYYAEHGKVPDMVQPMINGEFINLKKEFSTDGSWMMHTANPHHASNQPMTNDQLLAIFSTNPVEPWMFPAEQLKADHLAFVNEVFDELKAGKFPTYMRSDWMSSETGEIKMDPDRLALRMQQLSVRWTFHGRSLMESGHFIKLNAKGFHNRLEKWAMEGNKAKAKIVMPIGHAAYVHVTTLSIIHMLGYDPASEGYDTTKCFYYQQAHSWVKPDAVFIHDFERHGGEDGDDSEIVMIRKTYDEDKGETPETAVMRAVSVRMPCAWGEFSINEVDDSGFPYHNTWNDMPTVNITKGVRPEFVEEMKEQQVVQGLPYSEVETPESYTPAWVQFMTSLIVKNPGVGRIINPMIAYYTVAHSFFPEQLDNTEAFVDCLKQTPNEGAFIAIDLEIDRMLRMVAESGGVIDDHIYNTRIKGLELGKDSDTTIAAENTTFFSQMWHFTVGVAKAWKNQTNILARNRQEIPVKAAVKGLAERGITKPEMVTIIDQGEEKVVNLMAITEGLLQHFNERQSRFNLFPEGEARRHFSGNLCREITMWLDAQPVKSRNWILIQMYLNIWATKKKTDMFLFQTPLNAGDMSTMDYFLATLYQLGLAAKVDYTNYSRKYKLVVNNSAPVEEKTDNSESGEGATGIY